MQQIVINSSFALLTKYRTNLPHEAPISLVAAKEGFKPQEQQAILRLPAWGYDPFQPGDPRGSQQGVRTAFLDKG